MSKKKVNKKQKKANNNKVINNISSKTEITNAVKCIIAVVLIFVLMYFLTIYITKNSTDSVIKKTKENTTIQYDEILAGTSFNQKEKEYLVLFYNLDEDTEDKYYSLRSEYKEKEESLPIYYVDLSSSLNESCISTEKNEDATNASELKINEPTLIKFSNGKIQEYMTGEEISNYLK